MHRLTWVQAASLALCATSCGYVVSDATPAEAVQHSGVRSARSEDIELLSWYLRGHGLPRHNTSENRRLLKQVPDTLKALLAEPCDGRLMLVQAWRALIRHGVLRDGMTADEAITLMGPPTQRARGEVHWYHNYIGHHVFPDLSAREETGFLYDFRITKR